MARPLRTNGRLRGTLSHYNSRMPKTRFSTALRHASDVHRDVKQLLADDHALGESSIHKLRVATKKLRALWQLVKPHAGKDRVKKANANLRDTARMMSSARDQEVMVKTIHRFAKRSTGEESEAAYAMVSRRIGDYGSPVGDHVPRPASLRGRFLDDHRRWSELEDHHAGREAIFEGISRLYRRGRRLAEKAVDTKDAEPWHALRKWTKYLSLVLPVVGEKGPIARRTRDFDRLGRKLGEMHDIDELVDRIAVEVWAGSDEDAVREVLAAMEEQRESLRQRSIERVQKAFGKKPSDFIRSLK